MVVSVPITGNWSGPVRSSLPPDPRAVAAGTYSESVAHRELSLADLQEEILAMAAAHNPPGVPMSDLDLLAALTEILEGGVDIVAVDGRIMSPQPTLFSVPPGECTGKYVVYRLDFADGEHYIGMSGNLDQRLKDHRSGGLMRGLWVDGWPTVSVLLRCSWEPLAACYEQKAIRAALDAPTRSLLLNTVIL